MPDLNDENDAGKSLREWTPKSIEAEQSLLGAAILNSDAIQAVEGILTHEDFSEGLHGHLWEKMHTAHIAGKRLDLKLLISLIGPDARMPVGGLTAGQYIAQLAAEATGVINAVDYASTIKDLADQRRLIAIGWQLQPTALVDPTAYAAQAIEQLDGIVASRTNVGTPSVTMAQAAVRAVDAIALAYQRDGAISGVTWGLKELDYKTLGMQRGDLVILAGRPGMGKTAVGLTTARMAAEAGNRVLFESLEMGDVALTQRMLADLLFDDGGKPLSYYALRSGRFKEADFERVAAAAKRLALLPMKIEQRPGLSVSQIGAHARQLKRRSGLDLLVVDHLHLIRASDRYRGNKVNEIGETTAGLKGLAKELNIPVLALCQLSRGVEGRDDKRPNLGDLRGSGDIEQDADVVAMLYREAYYLERSEPVAGTTESLNWISKMELAQNKLLAIIEKQRSGPIGAVELFCNIASNAVRDKREVETDVVDKQQVLAI